MRTRYNYENILKAGLMLTLLSFFMSCKKFVQIAPPSSQIVTTSVFNNSTAATSAQLAIYTQMANNGESANISLTSGLLADELTNYSTSITEKQVYTNSLTSGHEAGRWFFGYNYIYQANAIIEALQNNKNIAPSIAQQLIGESTFIRAFWHFYLTNVYGDVPLVLTTDYTLNDKIARTPRDQVYAQIVKDLYSAASLLNANFVDGTDTAVSTDKIRPTKWAAYAMLARTYLYMGKFDSARAMASQVINNPSFQLCPNLSPGMGANSVFLVNSPEAIWQIGTPVPASYDTQDAFDFVLKGAPANSTVSKFTTISPQLLNSFEPGDRRKTYWIGSAHGGNPVTTYYFPFKYQNTNYANITEYTMVLRLAEQYLIRAEAEANLGDSTDAINDLNVIRARANLHNYSDTANGPLLTAILHERQVELFTEWGHRWFDLIRTGNIDGVMGGVSGVCQAKGGVWITTDRLFPISQSEINNDPHLGQNPGYN